MPYPYAGDLSLLGDLEQPPPIVHAMLLLPKRNLLTYWLWNSLPKADTLVVQQKDLMHLERLDTLR